MKFDEWYEGFKLKYMDERHRDDQVSREIAKCAWMEGIANVPEKPVQAIKMILNCPACKARHIDDGEWAVKLHHTHACQECGFVWRPAIIPTVGVKFLPGFKN